MGPLKNKKRKWFPLCKHASCCQDLCFDSILEKCPIRNCLEKNNKWYVKKEKKVLCYKMVVVMLTLWVKQIYLTLGIKLLYEYIETLTYYQIQILVQTLMQTTWVLYMTHKMCDAYYSYTMALFEMNVEYNMVLVAKLDEMRWIALLI